MARGFFQKLKQQYVFFWARRLPACDELLPLISRRMDQQLPWRQRLTLLLHNHICDWCRRYANQLLLLQQAMRQQESHMDKTPLTDVGISPDARERMKRLIKDS